MSEALDKGCSLDSITAQIICFVGSPRAVSWSSRDSGVSLFELPTFTVLPECLTLDDLFCNLEFSSFQLPTVTLFLTRVTLDLDLPTLTLLLPRLTVDLPTLTLLRTRLRLDQLFWKTQTIVLQ